MFASFKKKYFLSDKGISGVKRGVSGRASRTWSPWPAWHFLFQVMDGFVKHLSEGSSICRAQCRSP